MGRESRKRTSNEFSRDGEPSSKTPRTVNNLLKQVGINNFMGSRSA